MYHLENKGASISCLKRSQTYNSTFNTLWANSTDDKFIYVFFLFFQEIGFHACMKCQNLFSEIKKYFKMLSADFLTQHAKR